MEMPESGCQPSIAFRLLSDLSHNPAGPRSHCHSVATLPRQLDCRMTVEHVCPCARHVGECEHTYQMILGTLSQDAASCILRSQFVSNESSSLIFYRRLRVSIGLAFLIKADHAHYIAEYQGPEDKATRSDSTTFP